MPCRIVLGSAWNLKIDSGRSDNVSHGVSLLIHGEGTSPFQYRFWVLLFGFILSRFRYIVFQVSLPDLLNVLAKIVMICTCFLLISGASLLMSSLVFMLPILGLLSLSLFSSLCMNHSRSLSISCSSKNQPMDSLISLIFFSLYSWFQFLSLLFPNSYQLWINFHSSFSLLMEIYIIDCIPLLFFDENLTL